MNKIKYLLPLLLSSIVVRSLIVGASVGEALIVSSLSLVYGFHCYLESKKEIEVNKDIKNRLIELEEKLNRTDVKLSAMTLAGRLGTR